MFCPSIYFLLIFATKYIKIRRVTQWTTAYYKNTASHRAVGNKGLERTPRDYDIIHGFVIFNS